MLESSSSTSTSTKIVFVTMNLGVGGAERVLVNIANCFAKDADKEVSIIALGNMKPFYPLHQNIQLYRLDVVKPSLSIWQALSSNFHRAKALRKMIKKINPSVVISFMTTVNVITIWATLFLSIKTIVADRAVSIHMDNFFWRNMAKLWYRFADVLVVQTKGVIAQYNYYNVPIKVIPNALMLPKQEAQTSPIQLRKTIVMVGRLVATKKVEWGIQAFHQIQAIAQDWTLLIIGDGPKRGFLENYTQELGLQDKVVFYGMTDNVFNHLQLADIFLMTSTTEGYPNVLAEAMVMGLPCVVMNCQYGPSEMIQSGVNGTLVPVGDITGIAKGLKHYILDEQKRKEHGAAARQLSQQVDIQHIADQWATLFPKSVSSGVAQVANLNSYLNH